jgi:chromosome segregation and condensation protein ScpB
MNVGVSHTVAVRFHVGYGENDGALVVADIRGVRRNGDRRGCYVLIDGRWEKLTKPDYHEMVDALEAFRTSADLSQEELNRCPR